MAKYLVPEGLDEKRKDSKPRSRSPFFIVIIVVALICLLVALKMDQQTRYSPGRPDESLFNAASDKAIQSQLKEVTPPPDIRDLWVNSRDPAPQPSEETLKITATPGPKITYRKKEAPTNDPMLRRMRDMKMSALLAATTKDAFTQTPEEIEKEKEEKAGVAFQGTSGTAAAAYAAAPSAGTRDPRVINSTNSGQNHDPNGQARKEDFFYTGGNRFTGGYLQDIRKPQLVPQELKIGTIIPAILLTGIDSDLPGQLLAQVSENVYDTATGKFLLIPQGSRLVGIYDSQISYGQKRLMAVWTHLIWPDGSSLNLSGMPGIDPSGYSGFRGRVDNHYLELFLTAVVVSGFNFGYEAITDEDRNAYGNDNSTSNKIKDAVGEAVAALGARIAEREIARAPTIRIKPGYRFNVMLNKDIVFPSAWVEP